MKIPKSKKTWVAIFSLVAFILGNYGLYPSNLTDAKFSELVNLILAVFITLGIITNPEGE